MVRRLGKGPRVVTIERRKPLWLYPNLLSLDAPLVAVAWLHVFAETWGVVFLPWQAYVALGLVVWVIYVADRLLDSSLLASGGEIISARHEFHRRHRKWFLTGLAVAGAAAPVLVFYYLPIMILNFAIVGGMMVAAYFILALFTERDTGEIPYAKNVLGGLTFAYGTAVLAHLYSGAGIGFASVGMREMVVGTANMMSRELLLFGLLCALNISAIDLWERARRSHDPEAKAADELALVLPLTLLAAAALFFAILDRQMAGRPFFYAILTGAALLYLLNRRRDCFSPDALRVLADAALLAPVLVFLAFPRD